MKKISVVFILSYLLTGCAATHMIVSDKQPDLNAENTATLVIIRDQSLGGVITVWNYLDNKLIGETKANMYFITRVSPGWHYVIANSENITVVRMNFKRGRAYYLHQDLWPGVWRARAGLSVMSQDKAVQAMKECSYWEYDPKNPGEDLDPATYAQSVENYQIYEKEKPADYKAFLECPGDIPQ